MATIADARAPRNITEIYSWCNFSRQFPHSFFPLPLYVALTSLLELSRYLSLLAILAGENADGGRSKLPSHVWDCNKLSGMSRFPPTWGYVGVMSGMMDGIYRAGLKCGP